LNLKRNIQHVLISICNSFFAKQENTFQSHIKKEEIILSRKIKWMLQKNKRRIYNDISSDPLSYIYWIISRIRLILDFHDTQYQLSIHGGNSCHSNNHFKIDLIEFIETTLKFSLFNIKESWFTNLALQFLKKFNICYN